MNKALTLIGLLCSVSFIACAGFMKGASSVDGSEWDDLPDQTEIAETTTLTQSSSLSTEEVSTISDNTLRQLDTRYTTLPSNSPQTKRAESIVSRYFQDYSVSIKVYDLPTVLIFTLPNGKMRIHSGVFPLLDDNELAALIAHELSLLSLGYLETRVEQAHSAASAIHANLSAKPAGKADPQSLASSLDTAIGIAIVDSPYTETQVAEADSLALSLLAKTDIPIESLESALKKLKALKSPSLYANVHPDLGNRIVSVRQEAIAFQTMITPSDDTARSTPASQALLAQADREELAAPPAPAKEELCSGKNVAAAYPNSRTGWYVLSQAFKNKFDAELQTLDIKSMASDFSIVRLGKSRTYHVLVGPFYKKEYALKNLSEFVAGGVISSDSCAVHVKGKSRKPPVVRAEG